MSNYSFQITIADEILRNTLKQGVEAAVLAAAPGSGKTTISQLVIQKYLQQNRIARILVLTHGQNLLKNQYIESLISPNFEINFSFGTLNSSAQVRVGLPQSIKQLDWDCIDLLVVDECHEFYLKPMVQKIVKALKPKHQVLLTGSPSKFNKLKAQGKKYEITYVAGEQLFDYDIFSAVEMDVVPVEYKGNAGQCILKMLEFAKAKNKNLSKIMVAVKNIEEARNVAYYLGKIGRSIALSTCKNDRDSLAVKDFKNNKYDTLVVVQRGILGFSDNYITGVFDLRCSEDVDISNQLFARVLRKHPDNVEKFYYRCGDKKTKDFNDQVVMLHKIKAMMTRSIFNRYDGDNLTVNIHY
jgi:adenylate kinase